MTGFFVRILRGSKWENVEIDELTEIELEKFEKDQPDRGWFWARGLIGWIQTHVEEERK